MSKHYTDRLRQIAMDPTVLTHTEQPVQLASGEWSCDFVDGKHAVDNAENLELVGEAMFEAAVEAEVSDFEAVGGLVLGAVPFTFAVAQAARSKWFLIRKEPKGRGTNLWIEGARISEGMRVMLVDDVVTTGGSIQVAYHKARDAGALVVFATTLVDRGEDARVFFDKVGVPYKPMLTYRDIGIEPVGHEHRSAAAVS